MSSIPVLYYHRVGAPDPCHLSIPISEFRRQLAYLTNHNWTTLSMAQFVRIIAGTEKAPAKSVLLTFDDGFRDNYCHAFPLLREFSVHATIFPVTSLIRPAEQSPSPVPRTFTAAHTAARRGDFADFLSAQELQEMIATGLVDVHAHGHAHNQVFVNRVVQGIYPETDDHWGIPSAYRHPLEQGRFPVFARVAGLTQPALWPKISHLSKFSTFLEPGITVPADYFHMEALSSFVQRVTLDLNQAFARISSFQPILDADITICWPWGKTTPFLTETAKASGYRLSFLTSTGPNIPGSDSFSIYRQAVKKPSLARFILGLWLRKNPALARIYGLFYGRW